MTSLRPAGYAVLEHATFSTLATGMEMTGIVFSAMNKLQGSPTCEKTLCY